MRIHLYSLHGLFRADNLEIGRDADNGGQIIYVMELAKALSQRSDVSHVHLFTRRMDDPSCGPEYAQAVEVLNDKLDIRRIWCGGKKYLPKELLWDHLDEFVSNAITHIKSEKIFPDWMHSHYADAAYVVTELSGFLNVPYAHTGHSLGKPKLQKLIDSGMSEEEAVRRFRLDRRFDAEDATLGNAEFVVTSTAQEILTYDPYRHSDQAEFHVIPPGLDFEKYYPYYEELVGNTEITEKNKQAQVSVQNNLETFFSNPERPIILTICRPDTKKNIAGLIHAYGTDKHLQAVANLAIFAGIRKDIHEMPTGEKEVLTEILLLMDKYDLYGRLAIPKRHDTKNEVPEIYRLCARKKGVFVNIALTEPFGLTILESTACGCPVVATEDGGPAEIIPTCQNGILVSPTDTKAIQEALKEILVDQEKWKSMSNNGITRVRQHYSWDTHVENYLKLVEENLKTSEGFGRKNLANNPKLYDRLRTANHMVVMDIDGTLISEEEDYTGLEELKSILSDRGNSFVFGVASGRSLEKVQKVFAKHDIPSPDVVICSVGAYIYYGPREVWMDKGWAKHVNYRWQAQAIIDLLDDFPGLELQEPENQNPLKVSYYLDEKAFDIDVMKNTLGRMAANTNILITRGAFLDILPKRASKGRALRYIANKWSIPQNKTVVCGDAGNDLDMFTATTRGVVVGNHSSDMDQLRGMKRVYFSESPSAAGVLDGLRYWGVAE